MHKLILLFRRPADPSEFDLRWSNEFVAKAESMPGLRRVAVSRIHEAVSDPANLYLVHEFFFDDAEAVRRAMASPEGQVAGRVLMGIAGDFVSVCLAEHLEEDR